MPTATGRRCFGAPMLATESATTERCLSKGIPEPRPVAGMSAERDSFGLVMAGLVHLRQSFGGLIRESLAKPGPRLCLVLLANAERVFIG